MSALKYYDTVTGTWKYLLQGPAGIGIPEGGDDGDILMKDGGEVVWAQPVSFSDKYFTADFTVTNTVPISHNLNKYPSVTIMDSTGEEVIGNVLHLNENQLIVTFSSPFSGRVSCN